MALFPLVFNLSFAQEVEVNSEELQQISPTPLYQEGQNTQENEEDSSLIKEDYPAELWEDHGVVENLNSSLRSEWQTNSGNEKMFTITPENLPFSKMKQLMTIVSWNPWDITIQVLWNEMKVSEKWLNELKKLIQE